MKDLQAFLAALLKPMEGIFILEGPCILDSKLSRILDICFFENIRTAYATAELYLENTVITDSQNNVGTPGIMLY